MTTINSRPNWQERVAKRRRASRLRAIALATVLGTAALAAHLTVSLFADISQIQESQTELLNELIIEGNSSN